MTLMPMTAVITGGSSGIGAAMVTQFSQAGFQVAFTGTRPFDRVDEPLRSLPHSLYIQGDAGNPEDVTRLRNEVLNGFGSDLGELWVVANAGIDALDGEKEKVEQLHRTNVDGPRYLLSAFENELGVHAASRFVAVGSIVGTLGVVLPQNVAYQSSKAIIEALVSGLQNVYPNIHGITLSPGFIRTPMTNGSAVYGIIYRLAALAAVGDADLRASLAPFAGGEDKLGATPAEVFVSLLGDVLTSNAAYKTISKVFAKDPVLSGNMAQMMAVKAAQDAAINNRMAEILQSADILIGADAVAGILLKETRDRRIPKGGVLEAYQSGNSPVAPIVRLMTPLRPSAG